MMFNKTVLTLFLILFFTFLINNCAVNHTTGLITIYNLTDYPIHNIKISDTTIVYFLDSGRKFDYWIFFPVEGKVIADEVDEVLAKFLINDNENDISYSIYKDDPVCLFKTHYEYHLDIIHVDNKVRLYVNPGIQYSDNTTYDYPAK